MINLIPNEEKKKKLKDFYFRLSVTFFMVVGISLAIAAVGITPAFFLSEVKKNVISNKLEAQTNEPIPDISEETLSIADALHTKLILIEGVQNKNYFISKQVIHEIILEKMADIQITTIQYQDDVKGKVINISGTAPSRERLLLFRRALEDNPAFKKVDLPISNFVRGSNIRFSLTLIPA